MMSQLVTQSLLSQAWTLMNNIYQYHTGEWNVNDNQYNAEMTDRLVGEVDVAIIALDRFKAEVLRVHKAEGIPEPKNDTKGIIEPGR